VGGSEPNSAAGATTWTATAVPAAPVAQRFSHGRAPGDRRRTEPQSSRNREKPAQKSNENRSRTPSIVPKICTGNHQGVSELSRKNRRPISTQSSGNFRSSQEHEKVPQNENHRFLRARVDSVQLTLRVASTHVIARINEKERVNFPQIDEGDGAGDSADLTSARAEPGRRGVSVRDP